MSISEFHKTIKQHSNPDHAIILQRFFKTGPGEYGEGDIFVGIKVPVQRQIAKMFYHLSLKDLKQLLSSKIHEERLTTLFILIHQYQKGDDVLKKKIVDLYLANTRHINNWDLVDLSAPKILGDYLLERDRKILFKFVKSKSLWERRISILSTFTFIRNGDFALTFIFAEKLLKDKEDLIQKGVGWMLREIGNRDIDAEEDFLKEHYKVMPRTMLRYAIEKFPEKKRKAYLQGKI